MRTKEEILSNGKLNILKHFDEDGVFSISSNYTDPITRKQYFVKFTYGFGWEHLSASQRNRIPDWDTMCKLKDIFWRDDECCVQFHPKKEDYVNNDEHTLHIWKQIDKDYEMPPSILVGFKDMDPKSFKYSMNLMMSMMSEEERLEMLENNGHKLNRSIRRKSK